MLRDGFAIFILAHGRPEKCVTVKTLRRAGYTGKIYLILDNEDDTIDEYKRLFGEESCIVFDKAKAGTKFDIYDNFEGRNVIVFARNVCCDIARDLGLNYFAEFEDDYREFKFKVPQGDSLTTHWVQDFDSVCETMLTFLDETQIATVAFAQAGEYIGGIESSVWRNKAKRKAMNTFFFKVEEPEKDLPFYGRMNDDVNTYTLMGSRGKIFLQTPIVSLTQETTQEKKGGNTDAYLQYGTYTKSFYTLLSCPSCVKIYTLGRYYHRIHHEIKWNNCVPKIVSDRFKKVL